MNSILTSIKKLLGIAEECADFDTDIITHINTVLATLNQLNVGDEQGFAISDSSASWTDFMGDDPRLSLVKSYVYLKVRLLFDPPLSGSVMDAINNTIKELEWRILVVADPPDNTEKETTDE